jgi:hypothetical protein
MKPSIGYNMHGPLSLRDRSPPSDIVWSTIANGMWIQPASSGRAASYLM